MKQDNLYELCRCTISMMIKNIHPLLKELGLYSGQEIFLLVICNNEGITLIELANLLERRRSTITNAVKSLEHGGFIKRQLSTTDKRKYHLYLTEKGRQACWKLDEYANARMTRYDQLITSEEKEVIGTVLKRIKRELKKEG